MLENKKLLIGIGAGLFVLIIVIVIIATRGKGTDNNSDGTGTTGPSTITLWTPIGDKQAYQPFEEQLQEQDIVLDIVEKDPATYDEDLANAIASGGGPDIFMLKNDKVPKQYGMISPIALQNTRYSDSVKDFKKLYPPVVAQEMIGSAGDIFGYPLSSDPLVLYLNRDLFTNLRNQLNASDAGIDDATDELLKKYPTTWDEFKEATKLLTKRTGNQITQAGAALGTTNNIESSQDILYLMMLQNGTKFISSDGKSATFHLVQKSQRGEDVYPGTNALDLFTSFANPSSDIYSWNESMPNNVDYFTQGKLAMMIDYASRESYIQQMNPNLNFEVNPLPQVRQTLSPNGFMRYWAMSVNKNSKNINLSWKIISILLDSRSRNRYITAFKSYPIATEDLDSAKVGTIPGQILKAKTIYKPDVVKYDRIMLKMIEDVTHDKQPLQLSIERAARDISALLASK